MKKAEKKAVKRAKIHEMELQERIDERIAAEA